eukprot:TRINITY_DN8557_c0_g1_i2.p1 TRINITY_DN8557_c0_g1~~TRINITY_DN8557_c0_g1_i2.p1  ORF type:complete len:557 (-),score=82.56 TRINITY_DN8557_c0_g1_i2:185-1855(-)
MEHHAAYPLHLALAYLFAIGYGLRTLFVSFRLPGAVGVILSGYVLSHFMQDDVLLARDHLQQLSFFLVLLTAGFEISINDLKPYMLIPGILPSLLECVGLATYAVWILEYSLVEAGVLASCLMALGDGLVIPKMAEFGADPEYRGLQIIRLVFTAAPLEASFALTLFSVLGGLAEPENQKEHQPVSSVLLFNVLRILITLAFGTIVGRLAANFISNRHGLKIPFSDTKVMFTGQAVEGFLFVLAISLAAFGLGFEGDGQLVLSMPYSSGPLFQPELLVIVIGSVFAQKTDPEVLHGIENAMAGLWVFGQLVLFSMLGSRTELAIFSKFNDVWPLLAVGLSFRFAGAMCAVFLTQGHRTCNQAGCEKCPQSNKQSFWLDTAFLFLASLPRATIQGALGSVPATAKFFARNPNRQQVQAMILTSARLYIVVLSVLGSIALDILGRQVLNRLHNLPGCEQQRKEETEIVDLGLREQDRNLAAILNAELPELMLKGRNIETSEDERLAMDTLLAGKLLEEAAAQQQLDPSQTDMLQPSLRRASSRRMTTSLQQPTLFYSI